MSTSGRPPVAAFHHCPCTGATLDKLLQPAVLTLLAQGPLHGYKLAERVAGMPSFEGRRPDASGLYRTLRAMEERGLVEARWDVSRRGPARRLYALTPAGRMCLSRWVETLERYGQAVTGLLALARGAASLTTE